MRKATGLPLHLTHSYRRRRIKFCDSFLSSRSSSSSDDQRGSQNIRLELRLESIRSHI
ncbi:AAEL011515-PA [Aedes aegypti]|uniref:AAEL011515-PA n=1 Tax=Aedes aegypti TaxID=7159 RepID=Q16PU9_AEDAE|nr:AAEL011515-PA [Aedes aegypti]